MKVRFINVVVIEDDPVDALIAQQILRKTCENIRAYKNGKVAISSLTELEIMPELIILDVNMPDMNGFEFLEEFEKLPIEKKIATTIYMLTSSDDDRDREKAFKFESVKKFITKPLKLSTLFSL